jgi:hypothetical protein
MDDEVRCNWSILEGNASMMVGGFAQGLHKRHGFCPKLDFY